MSFAGTNPALAIPHKCILTCLQLLSEDTENLEKIPRMIKSLGHKAEVFNGFCNEVDVLSNPVKEACFDMQIRFLDFFTASIQYLHSTDDDLPHRKHNFILLRLGRLSQ